MPFDALFFFLKQQNQCQGIANHHENEAKEVNQRVNLTLQSKNLPCVFPRSLTLVVVLVNTGSAINTQWTVHTKQPSAIRLVGSDSMWLIGLGRRGTNSHDGLSDCYWLYACPECFATDSNQTDQTHLAPLHYQPEGCPPASLGGLTAVWAVMREAVTVKPSDWGKAGSSAFMLKR